MHVNISAISYYLPNKGTSNQDISIEHPEWSVDKISAKTGIYYRPISSKEETAGDMAYFAAQKLFDEQKIDKNNIDFIMLCTQSPDYFLPTTACIIQDRLKLSTNIGALDYNLGCSGYVYGLSLAKGLIMSKSATNILLLTSETYSKYIHPKDKANKTLFGDAATASLISNCKQGGNIKNFIFGTNGSGYENLIVKNGASRYPSKKGIDIINEDGYFIKNDDYIYMNGSEIFNFTAQAIPQLINSTLIKNQCKLEDIDLFVFHQANQYMLNYIRKKIGIDEHKFYIYLNKVGNTVSSTIPIALKEAEKETRIKPGSKVLIAGFGVGYSWGATIIEY